MIVSVETSYTRTELDRHANMTILGKNCFVFDKFQFQNFRVYHFEPTIGNTKQVPIIDAGIAQYFKYIHQTYLLLVQNVLHVKTT